MRKLRLDMSLSESGSGSSTGGLSPTRGNSSTSLAQGQGQGYGQGQRPPLGSRRSTLSRQITSEDLDDPLPSVSIIFLWSKWMKELMIERLG